MTACVQPDRVKEPEKLKQFEENLSEFLDRCGVNQGDKIIAVIFLNEKRPFSDIITYVIIPNSRRLFCLKAILCRFDGGWKGGD